MTQPLPTFDQTECSAWFERDRAHVHLHWKGDPGSTIIEWWDEAVAEAVEDGFISPKDWHGDSYEYAKTLGLVA